MHRHTKDNVNVWIEAFVWPKLAHVYITIYVLGFDSLYSKFYGEFECFIAYNAYFPFTHSLYLTFEKI